ncbi:aminoglycoside N(3)-acetyltransferase [Streptomyces sp. NPDC048111]|uniref:aminoglycoside N(3)-acetyltransferase n=1 Tax=Streptomyces sp. NPDC048111 TaxID=3365500 RepID=UPI00371FCBA4
MPEHIAEPHIVPGHIAEPHRVPEHTAEPPGEPAGATPAEEGAAEETPAGGEPGRAEVAAQLRALGVREGGALLVHASLRGSGPRSAVLLDALRTALGPAGTLVVPAFTPENSDTSPAHLALLREAPDPAAFLAAMPPFDPAHTPSPGTGRLAERVRTAPGAVRSDHPQTSFAALGARAAEFMAGHARDCHFGPESPVAKLVAADAQVLLVNVGFAVCSAFHHAEYLVPGHPRRRYRAVVRDEGGAARWFTYEDAVLDDGDFARLGADFPPEHLRAGPLGRGAALLFPIRAAVGHAVDWMVRNRP